MARIQQRNAKENGNETALHTTETGTFFVCYCKLDAETKVTKRFRNPRTRGYSVLSETKALLRARGFLNRLVTVGRGI